MQSGMPIRVLELHHHAVRVDTAPDVLEAARRFYTDVLHLAVDAERPDIPGLPGFWLYVGDGERTTQIHLMGVAATAPPERAEIDPTRPHVALAVADVAEARAELERRGIPHWAIPAMVGPTSEQIFMLDPCGNVIELHQIGSCRCNRAAGNRAAAK